MFIKACYKIATKFNILYLYTITYTIQICNYSMAQNCFTIYKGIILKMAQKGDYLTLSWNIRFCSLKFIALTLLINNFWFAFAKNKGSPT